MKLHIVREGHELGVLDAKEARGLVQSGFLRPADEFWIDDPATSQPLACLLEDSGQRAWLARATSSVALAGSTVRAQAVGFSKKASALVRGQRAHAAVATTRALLDYLPRLRSLVAQRLATTMVSSKAALQDEIFLRKLFGAVYDCIPKPVGRFVSEATFVEFCFKHRRKLL